MKTKRDCYEILGLSKNATANEIKKHTESWQKYHPDTNAGNAQAEERFKEVTEAYGILSDEEKKRLYDQFGYAAFDGSNPGAEGQNTRQGGYQEYHFTGEDMGIFSRIFSETSSMETHLLADRLRTDLDEVDLAAGALICMQM